LITPNIRSLPENGDRKQSPECCFEEKLRTAGNVPKPLISNHHHHFSDLAYCSSLTGKKADL
jgi:hypothetical protein